MYVFMNVFKTYNPQKLKTYSICIQVKIIGQKPYNLSQRQSLLIHFSMVLTIIFTVDIDNPSCFAKETQAPRSLARVG
jgi:hypothetical protein